MLQAISSFKTSLDILTKFPLQVGVRPAKSDTEEMCGRFDRKTEYVSWDKSFPCRESAASALLLKDSCTPSTKNNLYGVQVALLNILLPLPLFVPLTCDSTF